nr:ubiquitin hydrolase [Tanacetum cinerariifolium]
MAKSSSSLDNEVYDDSYCSKSCRKNTKNLNTKIRKLNEELSDCEADLYNYKRGLSQVEARLVEFKENKVKYCERIRVLERGVEIRDNKIDYLKNEFEQVKKEKESLDNKLTGFENASKDLDNFLGSQRLDKNKEGLRYNAVPLPPPPVQIYSPPKKDLPWTCLPEFVDDIVTDYSRPTPSIDASKCNKSELQSSNFSVFEHRESTVNTARPKAVINVVRTNRVNDVKASACWVWKPIKPNSASITLKRYDYVGVRGRSRTLWPIKGVLRKNTENLNTKISKLNEELSDCEIDLYNYKRGFENASKDLDNLFGSQRSDKNKEDLGYSVVHPPPAQIYSPPKKDLSWTGLPEFVDDTVTDYPRPTPSIDASKCNKNELQSSNFAVFEHGESTGSIMSKPIIKFVKEADCPRVIKTKTARKSTMKYDEMYRNISKGPEVRRNQRNWNNQKSQQLGNDFMMHNKACYICGSFDHLQYTCKQKRQLNGKREEKPV